MYVSVMIVVDFASVLSKFLGKPVDRTCEVVILYKKNNVYKM